MTKTVTIARASNAKTVAKVAPTVEPTFKGANADARKNAFYGIAPNSYSEGISRAAGLANFRAAIGPNPKGFDVKASHASPAHKAFAVILEAARTEWLAGRATARMPAGEFPKDCEDAIAKIDFTRKLIGYAYPDAKSVRNGGRRNLVQHKVIRAAEQALSVFLAELELSTAAKQSETDKKKRSTRAKAARGNGTTLVAPTHAELSTPPVATTADDAHGYVDRKALELGAYAKKNAKLLCADYGTAVNAFLAALVTAGKARDARKAAKEAGAHNA